MGKNYPYPKQVKPEDRLILRRRVLIALCGFVGACGVVILRNDFIASASLLGMACLAYQHNPELARMLMRVEIEVRKLRRN